MPVFEEGGGQKMTVGSCVDPNTVNSDVNVLLNA